MAAPDEIVGATTGAFELVDRVEMYVNRYVARKDMAADNIGLHVRLVEEHRKALQLLEVLGQQIPFGRESSVPLCDEYIRSRLEVMQFQLQANKERLETLRDEISNAGPMSRVRRVNHMLGSCGKDIADFHTFLTGTVLPSLKEDVSSDQNVSESYVPGSNIPPNPPRLTLDYTTMETCEGRLKAAILEGSSSGVVGVVASGLGGVGKTCALRGLANDREIRKRFADGILYIQLGNDARLSDIVIGMADAVEATGGEQLAGKVRGVKTVLEASKKANRWFKPHKCIFLVDDIWWVNGITSDVFGDLGIMLHDESLLVYTTRDKRFLRGADKRVEFEARATHGGIAELMLLTHARFGSDTELSLENKQAFDGILGICKGLPLAIGVAGATVSKYHDRREMNKEDAWLDYYRTLISKEENIIGESADRYGEFRLIVDSSLEVLNTNTGFEKTFDAMFRGFCILRKQQKVSGQVLQKLWSLGELREARKVAEAFDEVSLVQMTGSRNYFCVQLHDLVLNIAMRKASDRYEVKWWFGTLIENYMPKQRGANAERASTLQDVDEDTARSRRNVRGGLTVVRSWAKQCFSGNQTEIQAVVKNSEIECAFRPWWNVEDDGFIHGNLCRALQGSGQGKELLWLLERAQWVVMRLQGSGISGVEQDLGLGLRVAEKYTTGETEMVRYLKLVGSAARMSCIAVDENAYEAWFQMYGRMAWYARHSERTRKFLSEIEEHAPRPWVKPSVGFLDEAGGPLLEALRIEGCSRILDVCHGGDVIRILWTNRCDVGFVTEYEKTYGRKKTQNLDPLHVDEDSSGSGYNLANTQRYVPLHPDRCTCGAFSDDLKTLVTGYLNGKVLVWDVVSGYQVENCLHCPGAVHKAEMSKDGQTVVYGFLDGRIFVWDTSTEKDTGNPFEALQVDGILQNVDVSSDGNRIVCCDFGLHSGAINAWDSDSGKLAVPPEMQNDDVQCVAISIDGERVVSGSKDGSIRIWHIDTPGRTVLTMHGHIGFFERCNFESERKKDRFCCI